MSIAAIKAGAAFYEIYAKDKTNKGLSDAEASLRNFGVRVGKIGIAIGGFAAAGLTGIGAMIKSFAGAGDNIADAMSVTGLSSDFLQTLKFAAADAGVGFDQLVASITKSNQAVAKAAAKGGKIAGIDAKELLAMSPDERYKALAEAISKIGNKAEQTTMALAVFGRAGPKMLAAFEGGADALNKQMEEMKKNGKIMSPEDMELAKQAEGAFLSMGASLARVSQLIAAAVTPAFLKVMSVIEAVVDSVITFIDKNRELVLWFTVGLGVIGAVGGALMGLGAAAVTLTIISAGLATVWAGIGVAIAAVLSPFGLIVAAIVACGAAALVSAYYLDQLFNGGAALQFLKDAATSAATAISLLWTAVSNGRWDLAGQLIMDGISAGLAGGIASATTMWADFNHMLLSTISETFAGAVQVVTTGMAGMMIAMNVAAKQRGLPAIFDANPLAQIGAGAAEQNKAFQQQIGASRDATVAGQSARATEALAKLGKTWAEIAALDPMADVKKRTGPKAPTGLDSSFRMGESVGATNSAAAALLGRAAPANSSQEKQIELQAEGNDLLDKILGAVEGLEGLTAD